MTRNSTILVSYPSDELPIAVKRLIILLGKSHSTSVAKSTDFKFTSV